MAKKRALDICIVCISEIADTLVLLISGQKFSHCCCAVYCSSEKATLRICLCACQLKESFCCLQTFGDQ